MSAEALIQSQQRLLRQMARHYAVYGVDYDDLVQEWQLVLWRAAERYDPGRGTAFHTFAYSSLRGYLSQLLLSQSGPTRVATSRKERALQARLSRGMDPVQVAIELRISGHDLVQMLGRRRSRRDVPAEKLADKLSANDPTPEEHYQQAERMERLRMLLQQLPEREHEIIRRRHLQEEPETLKAVGERLGISRERVRQLEAGAIKRLRRLYEQAHQRAA